MLFESEGRKYEIIRGSDVINDGMFLELDDVSEEQAETVLYAFWSDSDNRLTLSAYRQRIPFDLVEAFVPLVRKLVITHKFKSSEEMDDTSRNAKLPR